jgi:probable F420-dependent oxidoreductase
MMSDMDWGIHLPHMGAQASRDVLMSFAQRAEELGYHSGWVSDHIAWPADIASKYPYTPDGSFPAPQDMPWLDPIGTLFFVAGCTERLKLGTTVLVLPYRPPVQTAKALASLDVVSGGRLILGVGVGWMHEEFDVLGMPFDHRGQRSDEQLEVFRRLFADAHPTYDGRFYGFPPVGFEPKPVQSPVPIWVGGNTEAAYRRTARHGAAFHAAFESLEDVRAAWGHVQELVKAEGRDPGSVQLSIRLYLDPEGRMPPAKSVAGSTGQMVDTIGQWQEIGVTHMLFDPVASGGHDGRVAVMERFMTDVAPQTGGQS